MSGDHKAPRYNAPRERELVSVERGNVHDRIRSVDPRSLPQLDPEILAGKPCVGEAPGLLGPQPTVTMPDSPEAAWRRFHMGGAPVEPLPGMPARDARALAQAIEAVARQLAPNMLEDRERQLLLDLACSPTVRAALALGLERTRDPVKPRDMPERVQKAIAEAAGVELSRVRHVSISARPDGSTWVSALVAALPEVEP